MFAFGAFAGAATAGATAGVRATAAGATVVVSVPGGAYGSRPRWKSRSSAELSGGKVHPHVRDELFGEVFVALPVVSDHVPDAEASAQDVRISWVSVRTKRGFGARVPVGILDERVVAEKR